MSSGIRFVSVRGFAFKRRTGSLAGLLAGVVLGSSSCSAPTDLEQSKEICGRAEAEGESVTAAASSADSVPALDPEAEKIVVTLPEEAEQPEGAVLTSYAGYVSFEAPEGGDYYLFHIDQNVKLTFKGPKGTTLPLFEDASPSPGCRAFLRRVKIGLPGGVNTIFIGPTTETTVGFVVTTSPQDDPTNPFDPPGGDEADTATTAE